MRPVPVQFATNLEVKQPLEIAWLIRMEREDGQIFLFNTSGSDLVYGEELYLGAPGFTLTSIQFNSTGSPMSVDMGFPIDADGPLLRDEVISGDFFGAEALISLLDYKDPDGGAMEVYSGKMGTVSFTDSIGASIELKSRWSKSDDVIVHLFEPGCRHRFGDGGCGVDVLGLWTDDVVVTEVFNRFSFRVDGMREAAIDNWYAMGAARWESGLNNGTRARDIRSSTEDGLVNLWVPARRSIEVGDQIKIHKGCQRTIEFCFDHDNVPRYGGFPTMPGDDFMWGLPPQELDAEAQGGSEQQLIVGAGGTGGGGAIPPIGG